MERVVIKENKNIGYQLFIIIIIKTHNLHLKNYKKKVIYILPGLVLKCSVAQLVQTFAARWLVISDHSLEVRNY